jgi:hypothetical protein
LPFDQQQAAADSSVVSLQVAGWNLIFSYFPSSWFDRIFSPEVTNRAVAFVMIWLNRSLTRRSRQIGPGRNRAPDFVPNVMAVPARMELRTLFAPGWRQCQEPSRCSRLCPFFRIKEVSAVVTRVLPAWKRNTGLGCRVRPVTVL